MVGDLTEGAGLRVGHSVKEDDLTQEDLYGRSSERIRSRRG
jgi:hypothetical protein